MEFRYYKLAIGLLATVSLSYANPIMFIFQAIGKGSVGTVGFTSVPFNLIQSSDTSLITGFASGSANIFETPPASGASIAIAGFGMGSVCTLTNVLDSQQSPSSFVALGIPASGGDIGGRDTTFDTYNLGSGVGPIITTSQFVSRFTVASTLGTVSISGISDLTFSAVTTATPVPGPGAFLPLGVLLLLGIAFSRGSLRACH